MCVGGGWGGTQRSDERQEEWPQTARQVQQSWVLDNLKTQAMILLAVLIFLLSGHFYSKSLTRLSLSHIFPFLQLDIYWRNPG